MTSTLTKGLVGLAATAYLDAKYGIYNDLRLGGGSIRAGFKGRMREWAKQPSLVDFFLKQADARPNDQAYVYEGKTWTYQQARDDVNRIAQYMLDNGIKSGDRIALLSGNSVAFVCIWLACLSIDVAPAFINHSLTGQGLIHCIRVSKAKLLLFEPAFEESIAAVQEELKTTEIREFLCIADGVQLSTGEKSGSGHAGLLSGAKNMDLAALAKANPSPKDIDPTHRQNVTMQSTAALIYTSGTTGLPKAALCSHGRIGDAVVMWSSVNDFTKKDRIYTPMPLYHSSAAFLCIAASWYGGSTVIVGRRFSASRYWDEVRANDATVVQYIGEIARYLLAVPPSPLDTQHRVRMAYGNGMRPDVWTKFRERFGVREISEFYASSEGNGALLNYNTGPFGAGGIGRMGPLARFARPEFKIARVDAITEDIYRDPKTGLCKQCEYDEVGEFLMMINPARASGDFQGYADNPEATAKKVIGDVFKKGDRYFRTGDLLKMDSDGVFYFQDRLGDTFRWRGENISTSEVAAALGQVLGEANVYGVEVPGAEGRAGCAAIPAGILFDPKVLATHARKSLPKYAIPFFLRIVPNMESTGTVKHQKVALRKEGIDHGQVRGDPLWWLPPGSEEYRPFHPQDYQSLVAGKVKL